MQIEMTIKGLMVDPITKRPIIILRGKDGQRGLPIRRVTERHASRQRVAPHEFARQFTHGPQIERLTERAASPEPHFGRHDSCGGVRGIKFGR